MSDTIDHDMKGVICVDYLLTNFEIEYLINFFMDMDDQLAKKIAKDAKKYKKYFGDMK